MGTTLNKLEYVNTTKGQIKTALNQFGAGITDETTFRDYVDKINDIYDNWDKTEYAEGSEITLNNTKKAKLDFEADNGVVKLSKGNTKQTLLPSEYQQVDYIESSGTQYIDTGVKLSSNHKVEMICKINSLVSGNNSYPFFGYRQFVNGVTGNNKFALWTNLNYNIAFNFAEIDTDFINGTSLSSKSKISLSKSGYYFNDTYIADISTIEFQNTDTAVIFAIKQSDAGADLLNRGVLMDLYSLKIWSGDTIVRDFVPCYRISDNVIGLYDTVNNTFYTNQGTGTFTKGANAPTPNQKIPIKIATGTQTFEILDENDNVITTETLNLGDLELCEIGNYADDIRKDLSSGKWYVHKETKNIILNGSENWSFVNLTYKYRSYIAIDDVVTSIADGDITPIKSNYFINTSYSNGQASGGDTNVITGRYSIAQINIFHNIADNNTNFKTWLSTHPTEVCYPLATPTNTEITDTTLINQLEKILKIQSVNGTTKINIQGNLPIKIKVRALKGV